MSSDVAEALERETTIPGLLKAACVQVTAVLEAGGCNLSRVIGQLLIDLVGYAPDGRRMQLGRGYLIPDYPLTQEVIEQLEPRTAWLLDPNVDPAEASILRELDFDALLMLPLVIDGHCWGLVEIYRIGTRTFDDKDVEVGTQIIAHTAELIDRVQHRAAAA